jgi:hypothetical protein
MNWDINVGAGLLAGVAAMVPGWIIYSMGTPTGKAWLKAIGKTQADLRKGYSPGQAVSMMLITSLLSGLAVSLVVNTAGATTVGEAILLSLVMAWFAITVSLSQTFFEQRGWMLAKISALNQVLTFALMGLVVGLFL